MKQLNEQELHNLAMNIVGKKLEGDGFEFLGINSKLEKNPQFVALKNKKLHFVVVRAVLYPENPQSYDTQLLKKIRDHALKFKARTFYAGVGLANFNDYGLPLTKADRYVVNYNGLQEIL